MLHAGVGYAIYIIFGLFLGFVHLSSFLHGVIFGALGMVLVACLLLQGITEQSFNQHYFGLCNDFLRTITDVQLRRN